MPFPAISRAAQGVVLAALLAAPAAAADRVFIGSYGDWEAFREGDGKTRLCYIASIPKKDEGNYTSRGNIQAFVTHQASGNVRDEVSINAGYTYQKDSEPTITIGGNSFKLFVNGDTAWARDKATDRALVRSMKAGATMVVRGVSSRGTKTTDTYSLKGFTAAYNEITKACGLN